MERIIALYESAKKGKTSTLNLLIDLLEVATTGCPMPQPVKHDRSKVFNYNGKIICITTSGDTGKILEQNCKYFDDHNCDIAFTATRKRSNSFSVVELKKYAASKGLIVKRIQKRLAAPSDQDACNLKQAEELLNMI